jgi:hypothetical protein
MPTFNPLLQGVPPALQAPAAPATTTPTTTPTTNG